MSYPLTLRDMTWHTCTDSRTRLGSIIKKTTIATTTTVPPGCWHFAGWELLLVQTVVNWSGSSWTFSWLVTVMAPSWHSTSEVHPTPVLFISIKDPPGQPPCVFSLSFHPLPTLSFWALKSPVLAIPAPLASIQPSFFSFAAPISEDQIKTEVIYPAAVISLRDYQLPDMWTNFFGNTQATLSGRSRPEYFGRDAICL